MWFWSLSTRALCPRRFGPINANNSQVAIEVSGYLIEELRNADNYESFKQDVAAANIFVASLIFIEDLADKVVEAVAPVRDNLDAAVVFPSMPQVMRLNKLGVFSMAQLGQSKSVIGEFMKKRRQKQGSGFRRRHAEAAAHPAQGAQVPARGKGPGCPQLYAQFPVLAGGLSRKPGKLSADAGRPLRHH